MYFGKGLIAKKTYEAVYKDCKFPSTAGIKCNVAIDAAFHEVGPHNVYDIYDNCPGGNLFMKDNNFTMRQVLQHARAALSPGSRHTAGALQQLGATSANPDSPTGAVKSNQSIAVPYDGPSLTSGRAHRWRLRLVLRRHGQDAKLLLQSRCATGAASGYA